MHAPLPEMPSSHPSPAPAVYEDQVPLPPLGPNLNVLMVWPRFPASFWGFEGVLEMLPEAP